MLLNGLNFVKYPTSHYGYIRGECADITKNAFG
jgi:hypothetical protein